MEAAAGEAAPGPVLRRGASFVTPVQAPRTPTAARNTPQPHGTPRARLYLPRQPPRLQPLTRQRRPTRLVTAQSRSRPGGSRSYLAGAGATPRLAALIGGAHPT